ncbi:hypothetical protein M408DRAFT_330119, partial [Serendipita vermifera MAFF 305830]
LFFEKLPSQHVWNPFVRELYPHRQYELERTIMRTLHRTNLIPISRRARSSTLLPPEIWSMILDSAIDIPFFFDTACDAKSFNLFIHSQTYESYDTEYSASERERKSLRAVCKLWAALLDRRKMRWLGAYHRWNDSGTHLLRVDLQAIPLLVHPTHDISPRLIANSIVTSPDQVTTLRTLAIQRHHQVGSTAIPEFFREYFVPRSTDFHALQSLIFSYQFAVPEKLLLDIQQSFSRLRFLRLEGGTAHGSFRLEELETLYLNVIPVDMASWKFPSLLHLALGERYLGDGDLDLSNVPAKPEQLLSLLLPIEHANVIADRLFWSRLASLQFLGVSSHSFFILDDPPISHPLMHLCFAESHTIWTLGRIKTPITSLGVAHVSSLISCIPHLEYVTMPTIRNKRKERYPPEWRALYAVHRQRGIKWLDEHGAVIDVMKRREERVRRWWENHLLLGARGYCLALLLLTLFPSLTPRSTID